MNLKSIVYCIEIKLNNNFLNCAVPNRPCYPVKKDIVH